jgi:hypothetical protein
MSTSTIPRVDLRGLFQKELNEGSDVGTALTRSIENAANHATSVFDATGDVSTAIGSIEIEFPDQLERAVREHIGPQSISRVVFLDSVLKVVGGGGIAGIPTAKCLHDHLPHDRKPTKKEMEEAWEKCKGMAAQRVA